MTHALTFRLPCYDRGPSPISSNLKQGTSRSRRENDEAETIPCSTPSGRRIANHRDRTSGWINFFQLAVLEEADKTAVGRALRLTSSA